MTTKTIDELQKHIEDLVRAHLVAQRTEAMAAVERAFAAASASRPPTAKAPRKSAGRRRASTEVAGLGERLYEAVQANPGQPMAVLAAHVGESARALNRPMLHLKSAGRVRSAGERSRTRYFPMERAATTAA